MAHFIFTRYLYEKEEVGYSFVLSILNKKEEEAKFWASELYYSGFELELYELIWIIFINFYAVLNLKFENYLLKNIKKCIEENKEEEKIKHLYLIIKNIIIRPYNLDIFSLIVLNEDFDLEEETLENKKHLEEYLTEKPDFLQMAKFLLPFVENLEKKNSGTDKTSETPENTLKKVVEFFKEKVDPKKMQKIESDWNKNIENLNLLGFYYSKELLLLIRILYLYSNYHNLKMGKNLIIISTSEEMNKEINANKTLEIQINETLENENHNQKIDQPRKIFKMARRFKINENINGIYKLKRNKIKISIQSALLDHWLYYASFSPIWKNRIEEYNGEILHEKKKINFENIDDEEDFYQLFQYEPDEQSKECQEKSICELPKKSCKEWIEEHYKKKYNGLFQIEEDYLLLL